MKTILVAVLALVISAAPVKETKASDIVTSVVVGVVVANYAGTLAGVAVSSALAGTAVLVHTAAGAKEAAFKAAQNDIMEFQSTGALSVSLENTIKEIQKNDSSVSEEEAMNLILEALSA